ncbi:MAG: hypothetical protein WCW44_01480 [archaeon]|jgi:hypothetical protein
MNVKEKGFIITVDSFISTTLVLVFVLVSFYYLSNISLNAWNTVDVRTLAFDEGAVLEKSLALENSVRLVSSESLLSSLNSTPSGYCFEATVFDASMTNPIIHAIKTGCTKNSTKVVSIDRAFIVRDGATSSFYIARIDVWGGGE